MGGMLAEYNKRGGVEVARRETRRRRVRAIGAPGRTDCRRVGRLAPLENAMHQGRSPRDRKTVDAVLIPWEVFRREWGDLPEVDSFLKKGQRV